MEKMKAVLDFLGSIGLMPLLEIAVFEIEEFSVTKLGATGDATELATLRRRLRRGRCTIGVLLCALLCSLLFALQSSPEHERGFA